MKHVIDAFDNRPLIKVKDRNFVVNPLIDHYPTTTYELIEDTLTELSALSDFSKATKIVGEEDRGGFLAALMAYKHKLAFGLVKWNPLELEGTVAVDFRNAYTEGKMYLYGVEKGDKVILVEDMVDSGGTIVALIELLKKAEVEIIDVIAVAEKFEFEGVKRIKEETGIEVKHLVKFTAEGEKSKVVWVHGQDNLVVD